MGKEKLYEDLRELLEAELLKVTKNGEMNEKSLEVSYKILDCIKDIDEICEKDMELEEAYSEGTSSRSYGRGRSRGRMMYPYMGSYAGTGGSSQGGYGGGNSGGYDYYNSRSSAIEGLQEMMRTAKTEPERIMYQRWLDEAKMSL